MIKLIVTDLDGTLLSTDKKAPENLGRVIDGLKERGVTLAVATGRDLNGARQFFGRYKKDMLFICDNGANIYRGDRLLKRRIMKKELVRQLVDFVGRTDLADCILCSGKKTYARHGHEAFNRKMENYYSPVTFTEDLARVEDDIFKVSIFDSSGSIEEHLYRPLKEKFGDSLTIHISRNIWVDVMDSRADKGVGVKYVQNIIGASPEQTLAFGDYYNDVPLFGRAGIAYVMENAPRDLKERYLNTAPSCDEGGVVRVINKLIFKKGI